MRNLKTTRLMVFQSAIGCKCSSSLPGLLHVHRKGKTSGKAGGTVKARDGVPNLENTQGTVLSKPRQGLRHLVIEE